MYINKIRIKNMKCFEEKEFDFTSKFTVLIGDNGNGKTTILDAIAISLGTYFIGISGTTPRTVFINEIRKTTDNSENSELLLPFILETTFNINNQDIICRREQSTIKGKLKYRDANQLIDYGKNLINAIRQNIFVDLPIIAYHGTGRLTSQKIKRTNQYKSKSSRLDGYYAALDPKSIKKEFYKWFITIEDEVLKFNKDKSLYNAFTNAITTCVPEWSEIRFSWADSDIKGKLKVSDNRNEWIGLGLMSSGFQTMVGFAADLAYRCIQLNPHLKENAVKETKGIVLIDELDMHLHPNWQKRVVSDLKRAFPNIQFIATTHSPFIVQSLNCDEVINLDKIDNKVNIQPYQSSIEDIAEEEMKVTNVQRSLYFLEMVKTAEKYYALIEEGKSAKSDAELSEIKRRLDELIIHFDNNPAYVALLKAELKSNLPKL